MHVAMLRSMMLPLGLHASMAGTLLCFEAEPISLPLTSAAAASACATAAAARSACWSFCASMRRLLHRYPDICVCTDRS